MPSCAIGGAQTKSPAEAGPVKREKSNETGRQSHLLPGKIEAMGGKAVPAGGSNPSTSWPAPASITNEARCSHHPWATRSRGPSPTPW